MIRIRFFGPRELIQKGGFRAHGTSESSSPSTSCTLAQVQRKLGAFERCSNDPKGNWDELAKQVTGVYLVQKASNLERMQTNSQKET